MGYRFFRYTKDDGSGNPIFYNRDGTQLAIMEKGTNLTTIEGGGVTGDTIKVAANSIDPYDYMELDATTGAVTFDASGAVYFKKSGVTKVTIGTTDLSLCGISLMTVSNQDLFLNPDGTGLVKFGVEITNAGSDRGKLINFKLADGTSVHIKTYDTV